MNHAYYLGESSMPTKQMKQSADPRCVIKTFNHSVRAIETQSRWPGQVPTVPQVRLDRDVDRMLNQTPPEWSVQRLLARPITRAEDVTTGMELGTYQETFWADRILDLAHSSLNEAQYRQRLSEEMLVGLREYPIQRRIIHERAAVFYRTVVRKSYRVVHPDDVGRVCKAAGERGGTVVGYTSGGHAIYASGPNRYKDYGAVMAHTSALEHHKEKGHHEATKLHQAAIDAHHALATHEGKGINAKKRAAKEAGRAAHLKTREVYSKSMNPVPEILEDYIEKAESRGGTYYRRVPKNKGNGYRYIYDKEKYDMSEDAHAHGPDVASNYIGTRVQKLVEDAGSKGCPLDAVSGLCKRYGSETVADVIRSSDVEFKSGKLYKKKKSKSPGLRYDGVISPKEF